jgi:hypothetical protein
MACAHCCRPTFWWKDNSSVRPGKAGYPHRLHLRISQHNLTTYPSALAMPAVVWNVILPSESKYMSMVKSPLEMRLLESEVTDSPKDFRDDIDHEEFGEDSRWPRRLLNVRNMTSYKWQPGNMYGGTSNPSFSILSYTWGRWRIRDQNSLRR